MKKVNMWAVFVLLLSFITSGAWANEVACELTGPQVFAGYLFSMEALKAIGILLIAGGAIFIFQGAIRSFLQMTGLIEVGMWATTIALLVGSYFLPSEYNEAQSWAVGIGALILPSAMVLSAYLRDLEESPVRFFSILSAILIPVAIVYSSTFVGFLAVAAVLGALGFIIGVSPFGYFAGFDGEDPLMRTLFVSLLALFAYTVYSVTGGPEAYALFEGGVFWLGSIASGIALLIISSRYYRDANYWGANIMTFVILALGAVLGVVYGVKEITTVFSAVFFLWGLEKVFEIRTYSSIMLGVKLVIIGVGVSTIYSYIMSNQEFLVQYLTLHL